MDDVRGGGPAGWSRRHYLVASVGLAALTGCVSAPSNGGSDGGGGDSGTDGEEGDGEGLPEGVSEDEFEYGPVPDVYVTATSIGGEERDPGALSAKADVRFSEYDEATENDAHEPGRSCGNCHEYVADRNGDGFGACAVVEGYIDAADWCVLWESLPEPQVPEGLTEGELATAQVPAAYRTAASQAGEVRTPEELLPQADVAFGESVERIAEGTASPGQSCGTCAEYIPDTNGDGWGACAAVEGYIAVEDWCSLWEKISEGMAAEG